MKTAKMYIPQGIQELLEFVVAMQLSAPTFMDKTGYLPFLNLNYEFQQLSEGLAHNRQTLGEERYQDLMHMSDRMRTLFEADPEDKTDETAAGCKIIHEMADILSQVRQKP